MINIKEDIIRALNEVDELGNRLYIDYPIVSSYPNVNMVPICIIQEENNTSIDRYAGFMETAYVEFRFILIDDDIARLNNNINKLNDYLVDLNFSRILYNEYQTIQSCRGVTLIYSADIKVDAKNPDIVKIFKS